MEDKNYRDDFEFFLKENADEFRMVPSRRIWYSLYNNMHPSRRWPSMAVCLLILTAVLYIGIENNNSLSNAARKNAAENFTAKLNQHTTDKNITFLPPFSGIIPTLKKENNTSSIPESIYSNDVVNTQLLPTQNYDLPSTTSITEENNNTTLIYTTNDVIVSESKTIITSNVSADKKLKAGVKNVPTTYTQIADNETGSQIISEDEIAVANTQQIPKVEKSISVIAKEKELKELLSDTEKSWKEDYAFRNKPAINKLKQNGSVSYYITPSVGYRTFGKRDFVKRTSSNTNSFLNVPLSGDRKLDDEASLNIELGAAFLYTVSKKVRIKTGVQGNYTNYISNVTSLGHPSQIALDVSNSTPMYAASNYSSASGNSRINKTTLQVSLPIGADVKITDNDKINWYVGATLQPTYIIRGSGYVLSSDGGHYASEPALLRKLNLNSSIESFISFKPSPGVTMMMGPQLRYQLFSSFKNNYNYSEKLYNVGIKLGISTSF